MVYKMVDANGALPLFGTWEETLVWSCLQGMMGKVYADDLLSPTSAMAMIGDFIFFAGTPNFELVSYPSKKPKLRFSIMVPQNKSWQDMILRVYKERATAIFRYATKKEPDVFDKEKLERAAASLPKPYRLSMIDERFYRMCKSEAWSRDLVAQFSSYDVYRRLGIGAVIWEENRILSGASSYSRYQNGIEVEADTQEAYRRRGFAYVCGAKLILECLKRNLYPSWDAHNKASLALAEKLGYHYCHTYPAVEIRY